MPNSSANLSREPGLSGLLFDVQEANHQFSGSPMILLIKDDQPLSQYLIDEFLSSYKIITASTLKEAQYFLSSYPIGLLIMAIHPHHYAHSIRLCSVIRDSADILARIPMVMVCAERAALGFKSQMMDSGVDLFFEKENLPPSFPLQLLELLDNSPEDLRLAGPAQKDQTGYFPAAGSEFLARLDQVLNEHVFDEDFPVSQLAKYLNMSRPTLYRRLKQYAHCPARQLIRRAKLNKAAELLSLGRYRVTEVSAMIAYSAVSNFSRDFKKQFGLWPGQYSRRFSSRWAKRA